MKRIPITENKKRIITLLLKAGELTKRQLATQGNMGWATVVKVINQLSEDGIVENCGISEDSKGRIGKDAQSYRLTANRPLAIGVDVEIRRTRIVLCNLKGDIFAEQEFPTPHPVDLEGSCTFLEESLKRFIDKNSIELPLIDGIGIGKVGITFPVCMHVDEQRVSLEIVRRLSESFKTVVRIESNTKVYSVFQKWDDDAFRNRNFMLFSIRTGVGAGIIVTGNLYKGTYGLPGEIGHMKVVPDGSTCRCGGKGCLETVVNQHYLFEQYRNNVLTETELKKKYSFEQLEEGLSDLFTRAKSGEKAPAEIVKTAAGYLGYCIANAITILDIPNIIISGHFGPDGDVIEQFIKDEIQKNILANMDFIVQFKPFKVNGFARGAALLILKDYLVDVPHEGISAEYLGK